MVEALTLVGDTERGVSRPKFFQCDDGNVYLVKFPHPPEQSNRVLLHDFLGYELAVLLDLPIPRCTLVNVSQELCDMHTDIPEITSGTRFAVLRRDIFNNINRDNTFNESYQTLFGTVLNKDCFPSILAFDMWIHNSDRAGNPGNWLIVQEGNHRYLYLIDHGHAFGGPHFSPPRWKTLSEPNVYFYKGFMYDAIKFYINLEMTNPFIPIIQRIESVDQDQLKVIFDKIPEDWEIDGQEKDKLLSFLLDRKNSVRLVLNNLFGEFYFPSQKGARVEWHDKQASTQ